jgi:hypothetical protein
MIEGIQDIICRPVIYVQNGLGAWNCRRHLRLYYGVHNEMWKNKHFT